MFGFCPRHQGSTPASSVAQSLFESKLPFILAHAIEYADYISLVNISVSSRSALKRIKSLSRTLEVRLDFSHHRGYCAFPKPLKPKHPDLHYCESLLSSLEPPHLFRDAMKAAFSKIPKRSAEWHLKELEARKVAWQRRLFAAMHPTIARVLPLAWRPCVLRKLWALGEEGEWSKDSLSMQLGQHLDEQDRRPGEWGRAGSLDNWARKVISNSMRYQSGLTVGWKLRDDFKPWASRYACS